MALIHDILTWTESELSMWQRDAIRRLFKTESNLSEKDYEDLYSLLKAEKGVPTTLSITPQPLQGSDLSGLEATKPPTVLRTLRDFKDVNRIAPGQQLKFSPNGITVIYGGNGSGKSGYARVMKRACRA